MRATRLTSEDIASHIREAGETCLLITPGVDGIVADALRERAQRPTMKASVIVDGSHHAERSGYGETSYVAGLDWRWRSSRRCPARGSDCS